MPLLSSSASPVQTTATNIAKEATSPAPKLTIHRLDLLIPSAQLPSRNSVVVREGLGSLLRGFSSSRNVRQSFIQRNKPPLRVSSQVSAISCGAFGRRRPVEKSLRNPCPPHERRLPRLTESPKQLPSGGKNCATSASAELRTVFLKFGW